MAVAVPYLVQAAVAYGVNAAVNALAPATEVEGPRLNDLKVQTSEYGRFLPLIYGTMKAAGTVIWLENNRLKETKHEEEQGGKGGPKVEETTYTYSATFAVAVSARQLERMQAIYFDSFLGYDNRSGVDAESIIASTELYSGIRFYKGSGSQGVDPRIQADKPDSPAYRGVSYIVFYDLQLEKFGNRIPNVRVVAGNGTATAPAVTDTFAGNDIKRIGFDTDRDWWMVNHSDGILTWVYSYHAGDGAGYIWSNPADKPFYEVVTTTLSGSEISRVNDTIDFSVVSNPPSGANRQAAVVGEVGGYILGVYSSGSHQGGRTFYNYFELRAVGGGSLPPRTQLQTRTNWIKKVYRHGNYLYAIPETDGQNNQKIMCWEVSLAESKISLKYDAQTERNNAVAEYNISDLQLGLADLYVDARGVYAIARDNAKSSPSTNRGWIYHFDHSLLLIKKYDLLGVDVSISQALCAMTVSDDGNFIGLSDNGASTIHETVELNHDNATGSSIGSADVGSKSTEYRVAKLARLLHYADDNIINMNPIVTDGAELLASIVGDLCGRANLDAVDIDTSHLTDKVDGFAVTNLSALRSELEPLQLGYQFDVPESGYKLKAVKRGGNKVATFTEDDLAAHEYGQSRPQLLTHDIEKEVGMPQRFELGYIDKARDYDPGRQYASRLTTKSDHVVAVDVAIVLSDAKAAQVAEIALYVAWDGRNKYRFVLPFKFLKLEAADVVEVVLEGVTHRLRLTEVTAGKPGIVECLGVADTASAYSSVAVGEGGTASSGTVSISGPTNLALLDIPLLRDQDNDSGFYIAAGGYYSGWRGSVLLKSSDGGESYVQTKSLLNEATMGSSTDVLASGDTKVIDRTNTVNVRVNNGKQLSSITEAAMLAGGNAAAIGLHGRWEIIKFQTATLEADGTYTLSDLIRGYKGTEHNIGNHAAADVFVLLTEVTLSRTAANDNEIGGQRHYRGVTLGKNQFSALELPFTNAAQSLKPYSPVDIAATRNGSNDIAITWTRRTRIGGEWRDNVGAQLGETAEEYEIDIMNGSTVVRTITALSSASYSYSAADQVTDFGSTQSSVTVRIYQISATVGRGNKGEATV